jgi:hypothetical protein
LQRQASEGRALSPGYAGAEAQGIYTTAGDASKAIGIRNILTHNYASVDPETVYETALQDVPKLRRECTEILRESEDVVKDGPEMRSGAD